MKHLFPLLLALIPAPALANYTCTIAQQCGGGTCEPFDGGPMTVREIGDVWQVELGGQIWDGYSTTTLEVDELSIVIPPQGGGSALLSLYPTGEVSFTFHAYGEGPVAITGSGTCTAEGG